MADDFIINKSLEGFEVWMESPCRFIEGDMICAEVFATALYKSAIKDWMYLDNPEVESTRFERDEHGIYQVVWMDIHKEREKETP